MRFTTTTTKILLHIRRVCWAPSPAYFSQVVLSCMNRVQDSCADIMGSISFLSMQKVVGYVSFTSNCFVLLTYVAQMRATSEEVHEKGIRIDLLRINNASLVHLQLINAQLSVADDDAKGDSTNTCTEVVEVAAMR